MDKTWNLQLINMEPRVWDDTSSQPCWFNGLFSYSRAKLVHFVYDYWQITVDTVTEVNMQQSGECQQLPSSIQTQTQHEQFEL